MLFALTRTTLIIARLAMIVIAPALFTLLTGCGTREPAPILATPENLNLVLKQAVNHNISQAVEEFQVKTNALVQSAQTFCSAPTEKALSSAQNRWKDASTQWAALSNYNFGPLNDDLIFPTFTFIDSYRLRGTNYLETVREEITSDLHNNAEINQTYIDSKTFQRVGLLALEVLLFETNTPPKNTTITAILNEYIKTPRKCDLLQQLSAHLNKQASHVKNGWEKDFKKTGTPYRQLYINNQLDDGSNPLALLLTSVQENLDYLQKRDVAITTAPISGNAWKNTKAAIEEVKTLLNGTNTTKLSFFTLMIAAGHGNAVQEIQENLDFALQSVSAKNKVNLDLALSMIDGNFKRQIPEALGIDLGINFTDGD